MHLFNGDRPIVKWSILYPGELAIRPFSDFLPVAMRARPNEPIKLRQFFWMVFRVQIYIRSELQIITQAFIGLRDDFKKDWAVSEDNCFCRVFYPSGRLHWEKRDCFVSYQNPTPIFSANHLA